MQIFYPYPELETDLEGSALFLTTPWVRIRASIDERARQFAETCIEQLKTSSGPNVTRQISTFSHHLPNTRWHSYA